MSGWTYSVHDDPQWASIRRDDHPGDTLLSTSEGRVDQERMAEFFSWVKKREVALRAEQKLRHDEGHALSNRLAASERRERKLREALDEIESHPLTRGTSVQLIARAALAATDSEPDSRREAIAPSGSEQHPEGYAPKGWLICGRCGRASVVASVGDVCGEQRRTAPCQGTFREQHPEGGE